MLAEKVEVAAEVEGEISVEDVRLEEVDRNLEEDSGTDKESVKFFHHRRPETEKIWKLTQISTH